MKQIRIFDTTLRDGEQAPLCGMNIEEKIQVAKMLEKLNVDVIEAGFAAASEGDLESIQSISKVVKKPIITSLARAKKIDIDKAYQSVKYAEKPRIHTFIATSPLHMTYKLKMKPERVIEEAVEAVKYAKKYVQDVEFSLEDATRSDINFMIKIIEKVINAGATTINIPDTVGYMTPDIYGDMIKKVINGVKNSEETIFSVHCHNDLGMAVANSLAGVNAGAMQVECTLLGIGERAGNAAMEELIMALQTRKDIYKKNHGIYTKAFKESTEVLSKCIGYEIPRNKAIIGKNAFAHESGIHQHGVLAKRETYEIMEPKMVGVSKNQLILGKHSGKHALKSEIEKMGYFLENDKFNKFFDEFKKLCDKKKNIYIQDIRTLLRGDKEKIISLSKYAIQMDSQIPPRAYISITKDNKEFSEQGLGDGPINAAFNAIDKLFDFESKLKSFKISAISEESDAQGEAYIELDILGKSYIGRGVSTDVVEAGVIAYIEAINEYYEIRKEDVK